MSIASEISRISGNVADAYTAANAKGATMPVSQNSDNLATTISTIPTGTTPTGTKTITVNGVYDVTDFASANVQVPTTAPEIYRVFRVNNGKIENSISTPFLPLPSTATDIGDYCYYRAYLGTPASVLSGAINLSNLTTLTGNNACSNMFNTCTGITSVDLSSLTTVTGVGACGTMFQGCTGLTSVDLSSLTTLTGGSACTNMFQGCTGLTSVDLSGLTTISGGSACGNMFYTCTGITSVDLSGLTTISGGSACASMFYGCTSLSTVYIGNTTAIDFGTSRTNQFTNMFQGCTQNIDVYAPAANQAQIESFSGYPNFGATGNVVWHWRS